MKKILFYVAVILITAFFMHYLYEEGSIENEIESRGIFISYIEYLEYFYMKDSDEIKKEIDTMIDEIKKYKINRIYLQVRPFSDSIYNSKIFPFSHTVVKKQGEKINLDILKYFIECAHEEKIELYAWINPYRISNNTDTNFISKNNPAYLWLNTNNVKIIENKGIYYNPASNEVKKLIVDGVEEIIKNYKVDGILFDDYFYPDDTIDLENYEEVKSTISLTDYRLSNVNKLIKEVYEVIKNYDSNIKFGVSPDGNIENNYNIHYADVKKWLKEDDYIDYIMPQIYYGFLHETKPFIKTVNEWNDLIKNDVELIPTLSLYKVGKIDNYAKSGSDEWINNSNMIKKQIQVSRNINYYKGFSLFRYDYLLKEEANKEIMNYLKLFNNS